MLPTLHPGQLIFGWRKSVAVGDVVLARQVGRVVVKRIKSISKQKVYLVGDNHEDSKDSRHYGPVEFEDIIGSIMIKLPHATNPPKLVKPYGVWVGRAAAAVLVVMALVHLFRIDTLIPILDGALPGGMGWATFIAVLIVLSEVFAVPFALRMRLSVLAHLKSGMLMVFAPLLWLLIAIWAFGTGASTGLFGEFAHTPSTPALLVLHLAWLGLNYYALWVLGYNNLPLKKLFK